LEDLDAAGAEKALAIMMVDLPDHTSMAQGRLPIRDWRLFIKLGVHEVYCPSAFFPGQAGLPSKTHVCKNLSDLFDRHVKI
jgi:hypothetical protein